MNNPNGGPAFPFPNYHRPDGNTEWGDSGMTLRDWIAGQALQGYIATWTDCKVVPEAAAKVAYACADAMLKQRDKPSD